MTTAKTIPNQALTDDERTLVDTAQRWFVDHRDEYLDTLCAAVRIPSVTDPDHPVEHGPYGRAVRDVFDFALGKARDAGFATDDYDGHAVGYWYGERGDKDIALVSHLDVVKPGDGWTFEPFEPVVRDGYVIGRGASDNKGAAIVDLFLLRFFKELGHEFKHPVRVIYGGDEEEEMTDLQYVVAHYGAPYQAVITDSPYPVNTIQKARLYADLTLPAGPVLGSLESGYSRFQIPGTASVDLVGIPYDRAAAALAQLAATDAELAGRLHLGVANDGTPTLTAEGVTGHPAFPEGTVNPILLIATALDRTGLLAGADAAAAHAIATWLDGYYGEGIGLYRRDEESGTSFFNAGAAHPAPGGVKLELSIRLAITQMRDEVESTLAERAAEVGGHVETVFFGDAYYVPKTDPRVQLLLGVFDEIMGTHADTVALASGTHARVIPNAVNFGPGFSEHERTVRPIVGRPDFIEEGKGGSHGADEWVSLDNLTSTFVMYALALTRLDAYLD
ncbi:M20 family peptidase PepV [Bifidobacterium ramosum]|nr:Sapep family Mn(2+)-dependent dipeptidase [Bifidobacterium ramosum]KAB8287759.1 M20 family peptidase PepV [Bifidobacterium ramosum]